MKLRNEFIELLKIQPNIINASNELLKKGSLIRTFAGEEVFKQKCDDIYQEFYNIIKETPKFNLIYEILPNNLLDFRQFFKKYKKEFKIKPHEVTRI